MIILCGTISIKDTVQGKIPVSLSFYFAVGAMVICACEFFGIIIFFKSKRWQLNEEKNIKRCGYIYQELNYRVRGGWALLYPIIYKFRFIVMVFATLFISEQTVYSILLINLMTLLIMALLGNMHPLTPIKENYYQIFFEFVIIMEVDLMLIATMPELDVTRKKGIGWAMVGILAVSIIFG